MDTISFTIESMPASDVSDAYRASEANEVIRSQENKIELASDTYVQMIATAQRLRGQVKVVERTIAAMRSIPDCRLGGRRHLQAEWHQLREHTASALCILADYKSARTHVSSSKTPPRFWSVCHDISHEESGALAMAGLVEHAAVDLLAELRDASEANQNPPHRMHTSTMLVDVCT